MPIAIGQRAAARFFVAFYRLNRRTGVCERSVFLRRPALHINVKPHTSRSYFATSRYRRDEGNQTLREPEETAIGSAVWRSEVADGVEHTAPEEVENINTTTEDESQATPSLTHVPSHALNDSVRRVMRQVPSSPVVVTAAHIDPKSNKHVPLGLVVSSFNTVTLNPPHISFNIKCPSKTLDAIREAKGLFRVHLLSSSTKAAQIVDLFARGNTEEAYLLRKRWVPLRILKDRYAPDATPSLAPQIRGSSVVAALECELTQEAIVADHVIAVAKVNSLMTASPLSPCLTYHNGAYKRTSAKVLATHSDASSKSSDTPGIRKARGRYWQYPLFPGKAERKDLVGVLRSYLKERPGLLDDSSLEATHKLHDTLALPMGALGVNVQRLVEEQQPDANARRSVLEHAALLPDFYGALGQRDIESIAERAVKLVRAAPEVLEVRYNHFFDHLSVSNWSSGLLASDILAPLRYEGLVPPYELINLGLRNGTPLKLTIIELEQIETRLLDHMKKIPLPQLLQSDRLTLQHAIDVPSSAKEWINRVHDRLMVEAFPNVFNGPKIDIKGELTQEEMRVAVHRIISSLNVNSINGLKRSLETPRLELLRRTGIHPLVSNIDLDFLFGKLRNLLLHIPSGDLKTAVSNMLAPLFDKHVFDWQQLQSRVRSLVNRHLLHVTRWPREDLLAAMGIDQHAKVRSPISIHRPHVRDSNLVGVLVGMELRARYGKGTPEEDDAIKGFLKSRYNYDVAPPEAASGSDQGAAGGSEDALRKSLNVHVLPSHIAQTELLEALKTFGWSHVEGEIKARKPRAPRTELSAGFAWKKLDGIGQTDGEGAAARGEGDGEGEGNLALKLFGRQHVEEEAEVRKRRVPRKESSAGFVWKSLDGIGQTDGEGTAAGRGSNVEVAGSEALRAGGER